MNITAKQMTALCPEITGQRAEKIAAAFAAICPLYGIDQPTIFHEYISNVMEESGHMSSFEENLNYRAERMIQVWPSRFKTVAEARLYEHNPQKLAGKVYDNRKDLGNCQPGDGWLFRGGGPIQLTGRLLFTLFTEYYNKTFKKSYTVNQVATLLRTDLEMGIHSACWVFAIAKKLIPFAIKDDMKAIVLRLNGGYTNMDLRTALYEKAKKIFV